MKPDTIQVIETYKAFWDAYNTQDWDAYLSLMCPRMRESTTAAGIDQVKRQRAQNGLTMVTVNTVSIEGDTATVVYSGTNEAGPEPRGIAYMARGSDGWKVCM
ncbi:MAG: nuclear transport factor 2 family protein [Mycobacterium sp.]